MCIPLQSLVDHTSNRLLVAQHTAMDSGDNSTNLELLWKCGLDGSGCHSVYDIKYDESMYDGISEEFFFFFCFLVLIAFNCKTFEDSVEE